MNEFLIIASIAKIIAVNLNEKLHAIIEFFMLHFNALIGTEVLLINFAI